MLAPTSQGKSDSRTEASATITIVDQPASEIGGWGSNKVHRSAISINATESSSQNSGILYGGLQHFKQQLLYDQDFPDPDLRTESQGKGAFQKAAEHFATCTNRITGGNFKMTANYHSFPSSPKQAARAHLHHMSASKTIKMQDKLRHVSAT